MAGEWREAKFSELCDISRGASPRPIQEWISDEGIPWVKIADASSAGSRFINRTNERIRMEGRSKSVSVFPGDLILSNSATPGIPMFINIEACIHDGWMLLRNFRGLDKLFAYYLLLNERPALVQQGNGSVFTNLKTDILKNHKVRLPEISEQRAIAHILGTLDDKIELNRRMNETLEAIARAVFKSWFLDFDPVRAKMNGEPPESICQRLGLTPELLALFPDSLVNSEFGDIPKGWKVGAVDSEFNLTMGQSPPGSTYNESGEGLPFYQGRSDFGFRFPTQRVFCTEPTRFADVGDTLVSVRAPVGDINMATERCCVGRGVAAVRHKSGGKSYTYYYMQALKDIFKRFEAEGTVFGSISKKDFHNIQIIVPAAQIISAFDGLVFPIDEKVYACEQEMRKLSVMRDALLPKLLSGELRVPTEGVV